jgi:hypothetical protein
MNAADILKYGDSFLQRILVDVPQSTWETDGVCGWWSVKNILSHLNSYEHFLEEILVSQRNASAETPTLNQLLEKGGEVFNDIQVGDRKALSAQAVLDEYNDMVNRNAALALEITPERWREVGTLPWYGAEYSLDDFIVYSFYGHKREHGAQIGVFKGTLKS